MARPRVCLHCNGTRLRAVKPGVSRVRDDLAALVPRTTVEAVEAGTAGTPTAQVVVGTEAALHRVDPELGPVAVVAFLELDQELLAPRIRAAEQALWLLVRGARLLGRTTPGALLLQTRLPGHEVVAGGGPRGTDGRDATPNERAASRCGSRPSAGSPALSGDAVAVDACVHRTAGNPASRCSVRPTTARAPWSRPRHGSSCVTRWRGPTSTPRTHWAGSASTSTHAAPDRTHRRGW